MSVNQLTHFCDKTTIEVYLATRYLVRVELYSTYGSYEASRAYRTRAQRSAASALCPRALPARSLTSVKTRQAERKQREHLAEVEGL